MDGVAYPSTASRIVIPRPMSRLVPSRYGRTTPRSSPTKRPSILKARTRSTSQCGGLPARSRRRRMRSDLVAGRQAPPEPAQGVQRGNDDPGREWHLELGPVVRPGSLRDTDAATRRRRALTPMTHDAAHRRSGREAARGRRRADRRTRSTSHLDLDDLAQPEHTHQEQDARHDDEMPSRALWCTAGADTPDARVPGRA